MSIFVRIFVFLLFISTVIVANPSYAYTEKESNFELTPIVGYRFGGDFEVSAGDVSINPPTTVKLKEEINYGLLFAWDVDSKRQGEVLISHNSTQFSQLDSSVANNNNLSITYAHVGGNVPVSSGAVPLFVTGGFGLTHLSPEDSVLDNETRFSLNVGLATKIAIADNVSLRFGGRVYATFFNSDSRIFCDEEACAISISSDLWVQSEVNAGVTFVF